MFIETSSGGHGNKVFVSFERTDFIQIFNISFYYSRFSSSIFKLRSMGRFGIQLLYSNAWNTQYTIPIINQHSKSSIDRTLVNLNFTVENYGIKFLYDQIETPHADMCFSNITKTHSVY